MIRSWFVSLFVIILFAFAYWIDLFAILSQRYVFYIALALVIVMLIVARIILGSPLTEDETDEKNGD